MGHPSKLPTSQELSIFFDENFSFEVFVDDFREAARHVGVQRLIVAQKNPITDRLRHRQQFIFSILQNHLHCVRLRIRICRFHFFQPRESVRRQDG